MVTRVYKCKNCGVFERKESIEDEPLKICNCGEEVKQIYGNKNIAMFFTSSYFYGGSFHRHPQKTSSNPNGVRINWKAS